MVTAIGLALISTIQDTQCKTGQVLGVEHGCDYVLNVCGIGNVALRGVEPPLRYAGIAAAPIGGGELLGGKTSDAMPSHFCRLSSVSA